MRTISAFIGALAALASPAMAQRDFSTVEIKTTQVTPGIYMLEGAGGNEALFGSAQGDTLLGGLGKDVVENFLPTAGNALLHDTMSFYQFDEVSDFAGFVAASSQVGADILYDFNGDSLNTITIQNTLLANLQAGDFEFIF